LKRCTFQSRIAAAALIAAAMTLVACGGGGGDGGGKDKDAQPPAGGPQSGQTAISIKNFEFKPQKLDVKAGAKVTWTNDDTNIHEIKDTSPLATPQSPELSKGDTFSITYAQPGSYSYVCGIHPYMTGSVEVAP
jgi:plastocyanin